MKEESIIFVFYLNQHPIKVVDLISFLRKKTSELFAQQFDDLSYCISDGKREKYKDLQFSEKNLNKYLSEIESSHDKGFQLSAYLDELKFKSQDFKFSAVLDFQDSVDEYRPRALKIIINKKLFFEHRSEEDLNVFTRQLINELIGMDVRIKYGFSFSMENKKHPLFFVSGTSNPDLTLSEEESCHLWDLASENRDLITWDIFYGNIITKLHLKPGATFNDIISIVGPHNTIQMDFETLYFKLPFAEMDFNSTSIIKNQLLDCINTMNNTPKSTKVVEN